MGSIAFMKLMRVRVPEGTRLKQAVYLSVNGELTAVFASIMLRRNPSGRSCLRSARRRARAGAGHARFYDHAAVFKAAL